MKSRFNNYFNKLSKNSYDKKLSIIVISYNMARELPRTIRSLSSSMQLDISEEDYEIIVVDNGSTLLVDENTCKGLASNLIFHHMEKSTVSPVAAINTGISLAKGELIGVFIDGARMASPGLLTHAIKASNINRKSAIATLAFHLGPKIQSQSIQEGYNQQIEDELLLNSGWEENGYKLFNISSLAGSSSHGYFITPAETNALFLKREHWDELSGYDINFISPGGGLVNLDIWKRICDDQSFEIIMLLGEGTFHQIHGGIATNSINSPYKDFSEEYFKIRGVFYKKPIRKMVYFGSSPPEVLRWMELSTKLAEKKNTLGENLPNLI